jgi:serine/threonine protein kinase
VDDKYELVKPIGQGAYGIVCAAKNRQTGDQVAIKKIRKAFANLVETNRTLREVKLLRHFKHDNVLGIVDIMQPDSFSTFEDIYIVNELMNTDLHQIIASSQTLTDEHVQYFVYQILRGLKYIHSAHVLHRDLKPSNLLVNANCDLKICDFGLARVANPEESQEAFLTEYVATRWYRAPEIMLSWREYTKAIDMWSVGCIIAEICSRKPLFPGHDYMHQLHLIIDTLGSPSYEDTEYILSDKAKAYIRSLPFTPKVPFAKMFPKAPPLALDLMGKLLTFAPSRRLDAEQALAHPYMAVLHDVDDEPVCAKAFDFDFAKYKPTAESLKALLWHEVCNFHPSLRNAADAPVLSSFVNASSGGVQAMLPPENEITLGIAGFEAMQVDEAV